MSIDWGKAKVYFQQKDGTFTSLGEVTDVKFTFKEGSVAPPELKLHVEEDTTPDFMEPIVGWRAWGLERSFPQLHMNPTELVSYPLQPNWFLNSFTFPFYHKAWKFRIPARAACFCNKHNDLREMEEAGRSEEFNSYSLLEDMRFERRQHCVEGKCGLYACSEQSTLLYELLHGLYALLSERERPVVAGPVYLWGRVDVHETGYRADYAYPRQLFLIEDTFYDFPNPRQAMNDVKEQLEKNYGVPVTITNFIQLVTQWASPNRDKNEEAASQLMMLVHSLGLRSKDISSRDEYVYQRLKDVFIALDRLYSMRPVVGSYVRF